MTKGNPPWLGFFIGVALAVVGIGAAYFVAFVVPPLVVDAQDLDRARQLELENNVRGTLLGSLAGVLFLVTAFFTYRQVRVAQQRLDVEKQGHVTERFTLAIEQLGHETVDVRLGGLFSLERLAVDEPAVYASNVYEILVAYLREHSRPERYGISVEERDAVESGDEAIPHVETDLETVFTILRRRRSFFDEHVEHLPVGGTDQGPHLVDVDLQGRWLRGANLDAATLTGCSFSKATLTECVFLEATLTECVFFEATLTECVFLEATLTECVFFESTLTGCSFFKATLTECGFFESTLTGCSFFKATLTECNFETATFVQTEFELVSWSPEEPPKWPPGFQPPTNNWTDSADDKR